MAVRAHPWMNQFFDVCFFNMFLWWNLAYTQCVYFNMYVRIASIRSVSMTFFLKKITFVGGSVNHPESSTKVAQKRKWVIEVLNNMFVIIFCCIGVRSYIITFSWFKFCLLPLVYSGARLQNGIYTSDVFCCALFYIFKTI